MMDTELISRVEERGQHLAPIMTTASTPATPGPSTPTTVRTLPLERAQSKTDDYEFDEDIIPPIRPQSTPFPEQEPADADIRCSKRFSNPDPQADYSPQMVMDMMDTMDVSEMPQSSPLCELPIEIHECILDYLFGTRSSAASRTTAAGKSKVLRGWGTALRHSRRREVAELALVSKQWRGLIQDRLYRHLKIKGTKESVDLASQWFERHGHLREYVKHIEMWFPVFQQKNPAFDRTLRILSATPDRSVLIRSFANLAETGNTVIYQSPSDNCSLDEVFRFIRFTFTDACILTLEGGERKKPPMVRHFRDASKPSQQLPTLDTIRTLVCKGQWNLIRENQDFQNIAAALPNLNEWHGSYAKPKSKSYISMATILPRLPTHLTHLNICLEADYRRESFAPSFSKKVRNHTHFCVEMAKAIPTLEHLAFTGRVCCDFFSKAAQLSSTRDTRLKTVDIVVKNICRPFVPGADPLWGDGSGVTDMKFIAAFETLVVAAIKSLNKLSALEFLRIRFIDLDSQVPALNPYFQLAKTQVTGLWSDTIVDTLARTRPAAYFVEKPEALDEVGFKDGQLLTAPNFSKTRPLSIKLSSYSSLVSGITIT